MKIKIIETYVYFVEIEENTHKSAIKKAKEIYENQEDIIGVADAYSFESVKFKIEKEE